MPTQIDDLIAQRAALDRKILELQSTAKAEAVARVRQLMDEHGLVPADLASPAKAKPGPSTKKVAAKYCDPATGTTWSGRGLKPKWLAAALSDGKSLQDFAIESRA
jgi:DNA-binding protein H-NS